MLPLVASEEQHVTQNLMEHNIKTIIVMNEARPLLSVCNKGTNMTDKCDTKPDKIEKKLIQI